jgi:hypothetical protein
MPVVTGVSTSQGTTFKKGVSPNIAYLTSVDGMDIKLNTLDTTSLDVTDGYKTYIAGFKEVSDVQISGYFDFIAHGSFLTDLNTGTSGSYTIQFPASNGATTGTKWTFTGIVTGFKTKAAVESIITFDVTIKVTGAPVLVAAV